MTCFVVWGLFLGLVCARAAKLMLEWLGEGEEADRIENAVCTVLREGTIRTPDIGGNSSTVDVGDAIASNVARKNHILNDLASAEMTKNPDICDRAL